MKTLGWAVVVAGIALQYALISYWGLPAPRALWLGLPAAVLGMFAGLALSWLGYWVLYLWGGLAARTRELDEEAAALARARRERLP